MVKRLNSTNEGWQGNEYHYTGRDKINYIARTNSLGNWEYRAANGPSTWQAMPKGYQTTGGFKFDNNSAWNRRTNGNSYVTQATENIRKISKNADQLTKARQRANRNVRAPFVNNTAELQNALWYAGAFKGLKDRHGRDVTYETATDGIRGNVTNRAIQNAVNMGYNVDINSGKLTRKQSTEQSNPEKEIVEQFLVKNGVPKEQVKNLSIPDTTIDRNGNLTTECAAFVNGILERNGIRSGGDSYQINSQFKTFLNGYEGLNSPTELNSNSITTYHRSAADNLAKNFNSSNLDPNRVYVANMYYTNSKGPSPHTVDYYNSAKKQNLKQYGTHVGLIYRDQNTGKWMVVHNIHGNKKNEALDEDLGGNAMHGWGITSIADAGEINPWYSSLPDWMSKPINRYLKQGGNLPKAQFGRILDYIKYPIQHTKNVIGGLFPDKKNYKNTIYINKNTQRLHYYDNNGNLVLNSSVSTGARPGNKTKEGDLKTPEGKFKISFVNENADKKIFGDTLFYGLSYGNGIGIHGDANNPNGIGRKASHGCIRMPNENLRQLQKLIGSGINVPVIIEKQGGPIRKYQNTGTLPEVMIYGNKGGQPTPYRVDKWDDAILNFVGRKVLGKTFDDEYVDLTGKNLQFIDINSPNNYNSNKRVIGNFFSETSNQNSVGTPQSFYNGQLIGDRKIPIKNFKRFVGVENGRLKVGDRSIFGQDTLITPVINKSMQITGPIDENYDFGSLKNNFILYQKDGINGRKVLTHDKVKAFNDYGKKYGYPFDVIQLDSGRYDSNTSNSSSYMKNDYPRTGRIWGLAY